MLFSALVPWLDFSSLSSAAPFSMDNHNWEFSRSLILREKSTHQPWGLRGCRIGMGKSSQQLWGYATAALVSYHVELSSGRPQKYLFSCSPLEGSSSSALLCRHLEVSSPTPKQSMTRDPFPSSPRRCNVPFPIKYNLPFKDMKDLVLYCIKLHFLSLIINDKLQKYHMHFILMVDPNRIGGSEQFYLEKKKKKRWYLGRIRKFRENSQSFFLNYASVSIVLLASLFFFSL